MSDSANAYRRLIDIGRALSAERDIDGLLARILTEGKQLLHADAGTVYLRTDHDTLRFAIVLNDSLAVIDETHSLRLPEVPLFIDGEPNLDNVASRAANSGETINVEDVYSDDTGLDFSGPREFDSVTGYRSRSFLTVPMRNTAGEPIGVIQLLNARDEAGQITRFDPADEPLLEALASQASVALENRTLLDSQARMQRQLEQEVDNRTRELQTALNKLSEAHGVLKELTTIDAVTSIRNRQYFDDVLLQEWKRASRQHYPVSMLLLDIDHFKTVNDTWGHLAGDDCLRQLAKAVDGMLNRPSDVVARFGGEEFVVILPYIESANALRLAQQIRQRVEELDILADDQHIKITISVGVATMYPRDGGEPRELIAKADAALYEAKNSGRNKVCVGSA